MRISVKGKYGLSAMVYLAQNASTNDCVTVLRISEELGISKIYLEQVFSLLKKAELVNSIKGSSGGYQLSRPAEKITSFEILNAIENSLFEETEAITSEKASHINSALTFLLWNELDNVVKEFLSSVTLSKLASEATKNRQGIDFMYFI